MTGIAAPSRLLPCRHLVFGRVVLGFPQLRMVEFFGHVLLVDEVSRVVMGIHVVLAVAQLFHQSSGRVAQVQRNRCVARLVHQCDGIVDGEIGAVTLCAGGQVDGTFAQRDASLGPSDLLMISNVALASSRALGLARPISSAARMHKRRAMNLGSSPPAMSLANQ